MIRLPKFCVWVLALAFLMSLATPALAAEVKGKIKSVAPDKNEFVLTDNDAKNLTFNLEKTGKVFINNKEAKLADLKAGDEATITYEKKGEKLVATEVRCTQK